jgi:hypothetical protein
MAIRPDHVAKMVEAQRTFDEHHRRGDAGGRRESAAVLGALFRNASDEERAAYEAQLDESGHVR